MTQDEGEFVTRLADEYKILQDKIDKIGAFRFTIKGWSITVIIGALFAGSATGSLPSWMWLASLLVLIVAFFVFEMQQTKLSRSFGRRAIDLENIISRILRKDAKNRGSNDFIILQFVPGIAHHLGHDHRRPRRRGPVPKWKSLWKSFSDAHVGFYLAQFILVCCVVVGHARSKLHNDIVIKEAQLNVVPLTDRNDVSTSATVAGKPSTGISGPREGGDGAKTPQPISKHNDETQEKK